jgi:hypothetical protein
MIETQISYNLSLCSERAKTGLRRMQASLGDFRASNEQSMRFVTEAAQELRDFAVDYSPNNFQSPRLDVESSSDKERAKRTRDLAEKTLDPVVRRILLSLADSYDLIVDNGAPVTPA